jgi:glycosyltransferase involved in cell wall biosynthesis
MTKTIHAFTRYGPKGASSRVRFMQYADQLERAGFELRWHALLDDRYLRELYSGERPRRLMQYYWSRLRAVLATTPGSTVWLEKEVFPWVPAAAELLLLRGHRLVIDIDDAVFHNYDLHRNPLVRRVFGDKLDRLMRAADCVAAGSPYLAQRAADAGARRVEQIPSSVDGRLFRPRERAPNDVVTIGWIGSPSTTPYLEPLIELLAADLEQGRLKLLVIGASRAITSGRGIEAREWRVDREAEWIGEFDIGVMPLPDTPWARGKCAYKLIQYMACGLPVIASPVGMNTEVVSEGSTGFLCSTPTEWSAAIVRLRASEALRRELGARGRAVFEERYESERTGMKLVTVFEHLMRARG